MRSEEITSEQWKAHFMEVLEGVKEFRGVEWNTTRGTDNLELTDEEIGTQIKRLKKKKAVGADSIPNEAWKCIRGKGLEKLSRGDQRSLGRQRIPR